MERCSWCATEVGPDDGLRLTEAAGGRGAVFCRLEHVVPWAIRGPVWALGPPAAVDDATGAIGRCARCGETPGELGVVIVRHRGRHRIADGFCAIDHLLDWAKAGGRYGVAR